jgi:integrase
MRAAGDKPHGRRLCALVVVMWRTGLRISEALSLNEADLEPGRAAILVRQGKGGKRCEVGMDVGLATTPSVARLPDLTAAGSTLLRNQRSNERGAVDGFWRPHNALPSRAAGRRASTDGAAPAPPRPCS